MEKGNMLEGLVGDIIDEVMQKDYTPILSGIKFLDESLGGYYPGEMTTICGGVDSGKSALLIAQMNYLAVDQHIPTLLVLNNMTIETFLSCMAAYYCGIEVNNIHTVLKSEKNKEEIKAYLKLLSKAPLHIVKAQWYEEKPFFEKLEALIEEKGIKIVFFDELVLYFKPSGGISTNLIKTMALKQNIPVVATCCTWNDREGLEGIKPALHDLCEFEEIHGNDVVISIVNYEQYHIYQDENGRDLHGLRSIEILKAKGVIKERTHLFQWDSFLYRNYSEKQKDALESLKSSNGDIDTLIRKLDLSIEDT